MNVNINFSYDKKGYCEKLSYIVIINPPKKHLIGAYKLENNYVQKLIHADNWYMKFYF